MEDALQGRAIHSAESVTHWRTLRERLETRIRRLETDGLRSEASARDGGHAISIERRYEHLLRLRRLHAKLGSRERLAVGEPASLPDRPDLHRA